MNAKHFTRNLRLAFPAALGISAMVTGSALAQEAFPSEPIQVVTHASAGGGTDTTVRMVIPDAQETLGTDISVAMKLGGGGRVAMNHASLQEPDGHTIMLITPTHLYTMARGGSPVNIDDIVGIARATDDPILIVGSSGGRFQSLDDLIGAGADSPVKWGTTHIGSVDHASAESFAQKTDTTINVVPFEGGGELVTSLMGGNVDVASLNLTEALDAIQRGDLKALAVMAEERVDVLPDTPALAEKGLDLSFSTVRGFVAMKDVPEGRTCLPHVWWRRRGRGSRHRPGR